jgi:hypothetical protein
MPDLKQHANEQRYNFVYWQRRMQHRRDLPSLTPPDDTIVLGAMVSTALRSRALHRCIA